MSGINFPAVKKMISLLDALADLGWEATGQCNHEARGPCPIHKSQSAKSRSFAVDTQAQTWYCHVCKVGGSVIDLWCRLHDCSAYVAALQLCHRFGKPLPYLAAPRKWKRGGRRH